MKWWGGGELSGGAIREKSQFYVTFFLTVRLSQKAQIDYDNGLSYRTHI